MNIALPVACYHEGNPAQFCQRALTYLGHDATVMGQWEFLDAIRANLYDFYFCVDSGGPLNIGIAETGGRNFLNLAFWMIDFRRGRYLKNPTDEVTCKLIGDGKGWIFQAQRPDVTACIRDHVTERVSWLPLAADEEIWAAEPDERQIYDVGFIGNTWDNTRANALDSLTQLYRISPRGMGSIWGADAAKVLRQSRIAFNISSFYGDPVDFDINMRVFDSLSAGRPLVTNYIPELEVMFGGSLPPFIRCFGGFNDIVPTVATALADPAFLASGRLARQWLLENATYKIRMKQALDTLKTEGLLI